MFTLHRPENNPIIIPDKQNPWESLSTTEGCPIQVKDGLTFIYEARGSNTDIFGTLGIFRNNSKKREQFFIPKEQYEFKGHGKPRATELGGKYYIFHTVFDSKSSDRTDARIALAISKDLNNISERHLVTPFKADAFTLFPEKIDGKLAGLISLKAEKGSDIYYAEFAKEEDIWSMDFWNSWLNELDLHRLNLRKNQDEGFEVGAVPVKTSKGWLVVYTKTRVFEKDGLIPGIQATLLDIDNPRKILGNTGGTFLVSETDYEKTGLIPNKISVSGALVNEKCLEIYYGAADTCTASVKVHLDNLLRSICPTERNVISRYPGNPIISPRPSMLWEARGTLNPASLDLGGNIHILYRAVSADNISSIGYARSIDGISIAERSDRPIYFPRSPFESKGCEDPRTVVIDETIYMTYTAYDGFTPRVALSTIAVADFLQKRWSSWSQPVVISPAGIPDKDSAILPEKINGKYLIFHRINLSVCADYVDSLDFSKEIVSGKIKVFDPRKGMWDGYKVGLSIPPFKTSKGWLMLYHGVSHSYKYRIGAVLLDTNNPTRVISRTAVPFFEPETTYEKNGVFPNAVFPCGADLNGGNLIIYYGAGDDVIGVATIKMTDLLRIMENCQ